MSQFDTVLGNYPFYWPWTREGLHLRNLYVVTPPTAEQEPISLDIARQHLRLDLYGSPLSHPDDELLQTLYIPGAREYCESLSGRAFALQEYELGQSQFPWLYGCRDGFNGISFSIGPVRRITSITYRDNDSIFQPLDPANYVIDSFGGQTIVYPTPGVSWPSANTVAPNAVRIRFLAGYGELPGSPTDNIPLPIKYKNAILLMLSHLYENRSATETQTQVPQAIEFGIKALLLPSALRNGFA